MPKATGLAADAFVIITGGASLNDTNKNVPWLFEQLSHLPDLPGVIVLAFGEGTVPVPDRLNVRFKGSIGDRGDLAWLFAAADVFVSASLMETYGLTLVEAMACGTPVVAFRVGGIPEAAPDGQGAILCAPQDGAALIEAITKLRNSPQLRERLGHLAHEMAHNRNAASSFSKDSRSSIENAFRRVRTRSANNQPLRREGAGALWFCDRLPCRGQVHGPGTLASMRHYCPDVPICLTVDGDLDVLDLAKEYQLIVLRFGDLPSVEMRKVIAGGSHAKHAAMWEGPLSFMSGSIRTRLSGGLYSPGPHRRRFPDFLERDFNPSRRDRSPSMVAAFLL